MVYILFYLYLLSGIVKTASENYVILFYTNFWETGRQLINYFSKEPSRWQVSN